MKINGGKKGIINPKTSMPDYRYFRRRNCVDVFAYQNTQFTGTKVFSTVRKAKAFMSTA